MSEQVIFNGIVIAWIILAILVFITLFFITAPYGRHSRKGWGFSIESKPGWIIMESASSLLFALFFILSDHNRSTISIIFLIMWEAHYIHRAFIYPITLSKSSKRIPILIVCFGLFFNSVNAYLNGHYIFDLSGGYRDSWISDPRFITGTILYTIGFIVNRYSDNILSKLRQTNINQYKVPYGGFFRWISSPNYLGEILIWCGWASATWSLPGITFAIWTAANLIPRAYANHLWYKANFSDYPKERRALIPGLW